MAKKPAIISFDDTEEDSFDQPAANSSAPAPKITRSSSNVSNRQLPSSNQSPSQSPTPPPEPKEPKESKEPILRERSLSGSGRPQSMWVGKPPAEDPQKSKKDSQKHDSGSLLKFFKGKKQEPPKKIAIGTPSNFHHVAGQSGFGTPSPSPAPTLPQEEPQATPSPSSGNQSSTSLKHSRSKESISSLSSRSSDISPEVTAALIHSDPKAFVKLTKKKLEEVVAGGYFLLHTRPEPQQAFISCSDDLSQIHFWPSCQEKEDGVTPNKAVSMADVIGLTLGYVTPTFKETGVEGRQVLAFSIVLASGKSVDLEAFTPQDKDFWVDLFNALVSLHKAQSIPQPSRPGQPAGPVSAI